jgi:ABC-type enterochelin transport system substrate-binding protein
VHRSGRTDEAQGELSIAKNSEKCVILDVTEVNHNKRKGVNQEESESKYILEG